MNVLKRFANKFDRFIKLTPEDLQRLYTDTIDKAILDEEKATGYKYIGGEFIFKYVDNENFSCSCSLFFQDERENFFKKEDETEDLPIKSLSSEMREELTMLKTLKYEIPAPSDKVRAEYERKYIKAQ